MSNDTKPTGSAWTLSAGKVNSATAKLIDELGDKGAEVITKIDEDPTFRRRIANLAKSGGYLPTTDQERAKRIMGTNYVGPDAAMEHLGVQYTERELATLAVVPFSEAVLKDCAKTHVLVAGAPLSILEIRERAQAKGKLFYSTSDAWYNAEKFATDEKVNMQWYLIRKDAVANSFSKNWNDQQALLTPEETTPCACEVVYVTILTFLVTGIRLFEKYYVRCSDVSTRGYRVYVGRFDAGGLRVNDNWVAYRYDGLGLASRRK
mgnify:CR=1 FL=1